MDSSALFSGLPPSLRSELLTTFNVISRNYYEHRWEPAELNGGKLCEVVYTIVHGALVGTYAQTSTKPRDMLASCRALEQLPTAHSASRSLRILIPRAMTMLYEVRNNRGVGHVGGEVSPNSIDAQLVYTTSSWIMAEMVRIFHGLSVEAAQAAVQSLTERKVPFVWAAGDIRRVLLPGKSVSDQVLLLLYGASGWVRTNDLARWTDYANTSRLRSGILYELHKQRLVEFDRGEDVSLLTPLGASRVEEQLLPKTA